MGPAQTAPDFVNIMVIDPSPNGVTLPNDFTDDMRDALSSRPSTSRVDKSALKQLGVKLGDQASLNGRTVRVAADPRRLRQQPGLANVVMSRQTQRLMGMANDDQLGSLMVRIKNPHKDAERVRNELNAMANGQYRAWTKDELLDPIVKA